MRTIALMGMTVGMMMHHGTAPLRAYVDAPPAPVVATPPMPRVRANDDGWLAARLHEAIGRSPTFRRLVDAIDGSDGIVYVEHGWCGHEVRACLAMTVHVAGPNRILRIAVDTHREHDELLASIGHELQHAIEALSDPHVTNSHRLYSFFDRIAPGHDGRFETQVALQTGMDVLAELRVNRH
jgi:hypothetical protein